MPAAPELYTWEVVDPTAPPASSPYFWATLMGPDASLTQFAEFPILYDPPLERMNHG